MAYMKKPSYENPSLGDLMEVVTTGFSVMDERFDAVEKRFEKRFEKLEGRVENMDERLVGVEHRLGRVEEVLLDIQEEFRATQPVVDDNSVQLIDHEKRIKRLERSR